MLLCDRIIQEAETERVTLVGILDRVTSPEFPFEYVRGLGVYLRITDAAGEYGIRLNQVRLEDEEVVGQWDLQRAVLTDRTDAYEIMLELPSVPFAERGRYEFRFIANDRFVAAAPLSVEGAEQEAS
jgi:hypothetical protein